jgi:hypothetical protein
VSHVRPAQEMTLADWIAIWQHDLSEDRRSEHRLCCSASNRGLAAGSAAAGLLRYPIPKRPSWLRRTSRSVSVASPRPRPGTKSPCAPPFEAHVRLCMLTPSSSAAFSGPLPESGLRRDVPGDFGLAGQYITFRLILLGQRILDDGCGDASREGSRS